LEALDFTDDIVNARPNARFDVFPALVFLSQVDGTGTSEHELMFLRSSARVQAAAASFERMKSVATVLHIRASVWITFRVSQSRSSSSVSMSPTIALM
jgi:hypothetical protein